MAGVSILEGDKALSFCRTCSLHLSAAALSFTFSHQLASSLIQ